MQALLPLGRGHFTPSSRPPAKPPPRQRIEADLLQRQHADLHLAAQTFNAGIVAALDESSDVAAYDRFVIITDSKALLTRYQESMSAGQPLHVWRKDGTGKRSIVKKTKIPAWIGERVSFRLLEAA